MIAAAEPPERVRKKLVTDICNGDCILFLGAGVHAPPPKDSPYRYPKVHRPPMGSALAKALAKDCEFKKFVPRDRVFDLQRVSLCYQTAPGMNRKHLVDALIEHVVKGKEPSPALRMLAGLPFKIFVTTNYDPLLERA